MWVQVKKEFAQKVPVTLALLTLLLLSSVSGTSFYYLDLRDVVTSSTPNVVFQSGNVANSTIFTNGTSARVTTPTLNYPTGYSIPAGGLVSGTVPGSVNSVDSNYFTTQSEPGGAGRMIASGGGSVDLTLPEAFQKVFRNPRGQRGYYTFYRGTVGGTEKCWFAYSANGVSWTSGQDTGANAFIDICSVALREDPAGSRLIVYLAISGSAITTDVANDIFFRIGAVADSGTTLNWLTTVQTVVNAGGTDNFQLPSIALASDGYLHIAYAHTANPGGTTSDRQNVVVCSSQTANPSSNPAWTCSSYASNDPFPVESSNNVVLPIAMPHVIAGISGGDVLIVKGDCGGAEQFGCNTGIDEVERSRVLSWDGTTQTWGNSATFTFPAADPPADERSATVNATSGRVHLLYQDRGTSPNLVSSYINSPYTSWSATTTVFAGAIDGGHLTITVHGATKRLFAFYVKNIDGDVYSKNATDAQSWSAEQTEYTNSTTVARWVHAPSIVNSTVHAVIPLMWVQAAATQELWFKKHTLGEGVENHFTFTVSATVPLQLNLTLVQQYSVGSVSATIAFYNYTAGAFVTSGQGYLTYTSSGTPNTDETSTRTITTNPQFYSSGGQVKIKVRGQLSGTGFDQKVNLVQLYHYQTTYDYVLKIVNQQATAYNIRLNTAGLSQLNLARLSNFTAWFHDGSSSVQLQVLSGSFSTQTGPDYTLGASATVYLAIRVTATSPGVSTIDSYLQIFQPSTTAHTDHRLTFKIT